jgi:hypothetical protein
MEVYSSSPREASGLTASFLSDKPLLRFGEPMSIDVGGIYIKADRKDVTQDSILSEVKRYWQARGAVEDQRDPFSLEPLSLEETGRLGVAVLPQMKGWIPVCDSEALRADYDLAKYRARKLSVETWWYQVAEITKTAIVRRFGAKGDPLPQTFEEILQFISNSFPAAFMYFHDLKYHEFFHDTFLVGFSKIAPDPGAYYSGATPESIDLSERYAKAHEEAHLVDADAVLEQFDQKKKTRVKWGTKPKKEKKPAKKKPAKKKPAKKKAAKKKAAKKKKPAKKKKTARKKSKKR